MKLQYNALVTSCVATIFALRHFSEARQLHHHKRYLKDKPNITTVYYKTDVPSMSPTLDDRLENLFVCAGIQAETATYETNVEYYVRIETNSNTTSDTDVVTWVSSESMKALANRICDPTKERVLMESCILSISSGTRDERIISCDPEMEASKSCTWYRGSKRLIHTNTCTSEDVTKQVTNTLKNFTVDDVSLIVNSNGIIQITDIEFDDAPSREKEVSSKSLESGRKVLTSSGTFITTITALTILGLLLILLSIRRIRRFRMNKVSFEDGVIRGKEQNDPNYIDPNWRDLGAKHTRMDCRLCNSQVCLECCEQKSDVTILQFKRDRTLESILKMKEIGRAERKANNNIPISRGHEKTTAACSSGSDGIRSVSVSNSIMKDEVTENKKISSRKHIDHNQHDVNTDTSKNRLESSKTYLLGTTTGTSTDNTNYDVATIAETSVDQKDSSSTNSYKSMLL